MVLDILGGAILLAFGIVAVYLSVEYSKFAGAKFLVIFLLGIAAAIGGFWIIITRITLVLLLTKIAGLILAAIGLFLVVEFPDVRDYQRAGMSNTGILIGLVLLIFGVYLLIFA